MVFLSILEVVLLLHENMFWVSEPQFTDSTMKSNGSKKDLDPFRFKHPMTLKEQQRTVRLRQGL